MGIDIILYQYLINQGDHTLIDFSCLSIQDIDIGGFADITQKPVAPDIAAHISPRYSSTYSEANKSSKHIYETLPAYSSSNSPHQNTDKNDDFSSCQLNLLTRIISKNEQEVPLSKTEFNIIQHFLISKLRLLSKNAILSNLGKDTTNYHGLAMCMFRLQEKFRKIEPGGFLIRSVRNKGYCLVQKIIIQD